MTEAAVVFNPFMPGFTDDPYPHLGELREAAAVHQHPLGFWMLTRYDEVSTLLRSGLSVEVRHLAPTPQSEMYLELGGDPDGRRGGGLSMLDRDPPDHTRLRKLVAKVFTPRAVAGLEPHIVELVDAALDQIADAGQVNLVETLAFPLPFAVISEMLGVPKSNHERVRELGGILVRSLEPVNDPEVVKAIIAADEELAQIGAELIEWKRSNPADDLLTALINAEEGGDVLSDDELVAQLILLYIAGHETTVNLIANGVIALLRNPDQLALLRERPELIDTAVEELLRYDSPVQMSRRITTEPFSLAGQEIPPGTFVLASLASANRDPAHWGPDADKLRVDRADARSHLSFGSGIHHCLGAALARLEGKVAIGRLADRFPALALDGEITWNGRINLRGPQALPVTV